MIANVSSLNTGQYNKKNVRGISFKHSPFRNIRNHVQPTNPECPNLFAHWMPPPGGRDTFFARRKTSGTMEDIWRCLAQKSETEVNVAKSIWTHSEIEMKQTAQILSETHYFTIDCDTDHDNLANLYNTFKFSFTFHFRQIKTFMAY